MTKMPPIEKVYEAWTAIADGRVEIGQYDARVTSSDLTKVYTVRYDAATRTYYANDNATFWQRYPGYPIIAVMMMRGQLPLDQSMCSEWAEINWTALNKAHKADYAAAVAAVEAERGIDSAKALAAASAVMTALEKADINVARLIGVAVAPPVSA